MGLNDVLRKITSLKADANVHLISLSAEDFGNVHADAWFAPTFITRDGRTAMRLGGVTIASQRDY